MSYLSPPRLHFSGQFLADPSTLNNTPNNYNPQNDFPTAGRDALGLDATNNLDLFWNPYGRGTFGFVGCEVTKVTYGDGRSATTRDEDPIIGTAVASNAGLAPAKIVDLDPMQQNVSEIWGMSLDVGGRTSGSVSGDYREGPYAWIWLQAKGVPPGDTAGSGMYQSVLENLSWNPGSSDSRFLHELAQASPERLSINFAVHAHNSRPHMFLVSKKTVAAMKKAGVPSSVTALLAPLMQYRQMPTSTPGLIPTEAYFKVLVKEHAGAEAFDRYWTTIRKESAQPYRAPTPHPFVHGGSAGTIGPSSAGEPLYFTPARVLTPPAEQLSEPKFSPYNPPCTFAPAATSTAGGETTVAINLSNSLPTRLPGTDWDGDVLGNLFLCTFDARSTSPLDGVELLGRVDYADHRRFWTEGAGFVTLTTGADVSDRPLGLVRVDDEGNPQEMLLQENPYGVYCRADRFVYRINPGVKASHDPRTGNPATVDFYASRFGTPLSGLEIAVSLMSPEEARSYTNSTPGTGGSPGVDNLSIPQSALQPAAATVVTGSDGKASLTLTASDPGNPRSYVDGQIYFLRYRPVASGIHFVQAPDDLISIQIYQQNLRGLPAAVRLAGRVTWDNSIRYVLGQYGKLYPYMATIVELGSYESVKKNAAQIRQVLASDLNSPIHMPVTRDLSASRRALILRWVEDGMPES